MSSRRSSDLEYGLTMFGFDPFFDFFSVAVPLRHSVIELFYSR